VLRWRKASGRCFQRPTADFLLADFPVRSNIAQKIIPGLKFDNALSQKIEDYAMPYKPGDTVPASGIYQVTHETRHHQPHDVTCIEGKKFPPCKTCAHPRFVLKYKAQHIADHSSFS
jgi:hypothetical protein